jgi:acyl dehydratase
MASKAEQGHAIFQGYVGKEEGVGEWFAIDQARINQFADATLDHQFIHIDPERSAKLSPYKVTVAHGFLTLSMIVHLGKSVPPVAPEAYQGVVIGVNYGLDKVRFPNPVKVGSKVRAPQLLAADLVAPNTIQLSSASRWRSRARQSPAVAESLTA